MSEKRPLRERHPSGGYGSREDGWDEDPFGYEARELGVTTYDSLTGCAITLNYIIGTGCFGLPMAFYQGGLVFGTLLLVLGCLVMFVSATYVLENMARTRGILMARGDGPPENFIGYIKYGYSDMSQLFGGSKGRIAVQFVIWSYAFGTLAAYSSMFASSTASLFCDNVLKQQCDVFGPNPSPACLSSYYIFMAIFALIVISLALRDMGDQAAIQRLLSAYRVVAFSLMLLTLSIKLFNDRDVIADRARNIGAFNPSHFADGFGPVFLAMCMHYNIPDAVQPVRNKDAAGIVTYTALAVSSAIYLLFGLGGALAWDKPNAVASLNWTTYTSCGDGWQECESPWRSVIGQLVKYTVVLFPVVTVTSAFPLVCVSVGDNLMTSVPDSYVSDLGTDMTKKVLRLLAALPPLLFATAFRGITFLFAFTGLFGFIIGLVIPSSLQLITNKYYAAKYPSHPGAGRTPYSNFLGSSLVAGILFIISIAATACGFATVKI